MAQIQPVLLGADMNCYSVARAFHEAYGVKTQAFGRWAMGETQYSRIVDFTAVADFDTDPVMLDTLEAYALANPGDEKILLGCTDDYATMIIRNRDALRRWYIVPYIDNALALRLASKEHFYQYCDQFGIDYPGTVILKGREDMPLLDVLPFPWPVIIKPSSSISYWKHEFEGMKKVYTAGDASEAKRVCDVIFSSGYPDSIIIQDMIPGPDDRMRVLTAYVDRESRVRMACLGQVLLEEHTPRALGNHAAILTEYDGPLMHKLADFLEAIGYTGFANFDIKYDERDGKYKVFEINLRQGRSNYYVTGAGLNIARYVVDDWVENAPAGEPLYFDRETYWHSIPNRVVWAYTADRSCVRRAQAIAKAGRDTTALDYAYDLRGNLMRRVYLWEHYRRYHKKYATYCNKPQG